MKRNIIILSTLLLVLIIATVVVYIVKFRQPETKDAQSEEVSANFNKEDYEPDININVTETLDQAEESIKSNKDKAIFYDSSEVTVDDSLEIPFSIYQYINTDISNDDAFCIAYLVSEWAKSIDVNPESIQYLGNNFGQGSEDLYITIQANEDIVEVHFASTDNGTFGYIKEM